MTEPTDRHPDHELDRRVQEQIQRLNAERGWPHQQPGTVSVALDDAGNVVEVTVADDGTRTERLLEDRRD